MDTQSALSKVVGLMLLALLLLSCPLQAQEESAGTISTERGDPSDEAIERRLTNIFQEIDGLESISVAAEAGVVTLSGQVVVPELIEQAERLASAVEGVVTVQNDLLRDNRFTQQLQPIRDKLLNLATSILTSLPMLLLAGFTIVAFAWIGGWLSQVVPLPQSWAPNIFVTDLVRIAIHILLILIGIILAAELLGATALLVSILGGLGVVGLALGFAIRDTVENFVASVLLSLRQPFGTKEYVSIDGIEGSIVRLTSRATIMLDLNGNHIRIPNSVVYKSTIINYTRNPKRRFHFDVGVDTDINPAVAQELAIDALTGIDGVLADPKPLCIIHALGDSNVLLRAFAWIDQNNADFNKTRSAGMAEVKRFFENADVIMPEPIYRLRVENVDANKASAKTSNPTKPASTIDPTILVADTTIIAQVEHEEDGDDLLSSSAARE